MKVKIKEILACYPCRDVLDRLYVWAGPDPETVVSLGEILENSGPEDAFWALRCWSAEVYRSLLADVAAFVLPTWTAVYPGDDRPRYAIDTARADAPSAVAASEAAWEASREASAVAAWEASQEASRAASPYTIPTRPTRPTISHPASAAALAASEVWTAKINPEAGIKLAVAAVAAGASWDQLGVMMRVWLENTEKEGKR